MKSAISILLLIITAPAALLAGQNGPTSETLRQASSLKVAQASFETSYTVSRHESALAALSDAASSANIRESHLASESVNAEFQTQNAPTSLSSSRLSQLQDSNQFGSPLNESDISHLTR